MIDCTPSPAICQAARELLGPDGDRPHKLIPLLMEGLGRHLQLRAAQIAGHPLTRQEREELEGWPLAHRWALAKVRGDIRHAWPAPDVEGC